MPKAPVGLGVIDVVLPLPRMADVIMEVAEKTRPTWDRSGRDDWWGLGREDFECAEIGATIWCTPAGSVG